MAAKKNPSTPSEQIPPQGNDVTSELDTLRHIVFGTAKAQIEADLAALKNQMNHQFEQLQHSMDNKFEQMHKDMQHGFESLTVRLDDVNKHHENRSDEIQSYTDKLSSELEMTDTNSRQDSDELHSRVDKEVRQLTEKYDARFAEALERLDQVTKELSSSKTDRKTLAKLLSTMAVNLETDED